MCPISASMVDSETPFSASRVAEGMPEVVEAAGNLGILSQLVPAARNVSGVATGVRRDGLAPWKQVVAWLRFPELVYEPDAVSR